MNVTTILIQATALMAVLVLLRPLLKRYLSARARCALWAIPAARLIFPFEIKSAFSLMKAAKPVEQAVESVAAVPVLREPLQWAFEGEPTMTAPVGAPTLTAPEMTAPDLSVAAEPALSLGQVLLALWAVGAIVTLVWFIWANVRFFRTAKRMATPFETDCKLPVYLYPELATPCLAGVFRPRIYLNERAVSNEAVLRMTLRHELTHYKRLDHIWGLMRGLLTAVYWFHPLVWLCGEHFRSDSEAACDERATRGMSGEEREDYGLALIMLAGKRPNRGLMVCLSTMSGGKKLLYERIRFLSRSRKAVRVAAVAAAMLAVILVCTMCTAPSEDEEQSGQPDTEQSESNGPDAEQKGDPAPAQAQTPPPTPSASPEAEPETLSGQALELAYCIELSTLNEFQDMDQEQTLHWLGEYGDLLKDYRFIARERLDGEGAYILGEYWGEGESPMQGLSTYGIGMSNLLLCREEDYPDDDFKVADLMMGKGDWRDYGTVITQTNVHQHFLDRPMVVITPKNGDSYYTVVDDYVKRGAAYIMESAEEGVMITMPSRRPYLEVYQVSPEFGELCRYIPLTDEQVEKILAEEPIMLTEGLGFCARLCAEDEDIYYTERLGVSPTVLDLALERCDYRWGDPSYIVGPVLGATLEGHWLEEPMRADESQLERLGEILKNAEHTYVGACGYGAKITLELTAGERVTFMKGTDDCDSVVFGSWGGYSLGDAENTEFWNIFGLDAHTKMPLK